MRWSIILVFALLLTACKKDDGPTPSGSLQVLNDQSFQSNVKNSNGVSVVFFHAAWCHLCHDQRPHVEDAATDSDLSEVFFGEIDHVDYKSVFDAEGVSFFPQVWIYQNGEFKTAVTGSSPVTANDIKQAVSAYL